MGSWIQEMRITQTQTQTQYRQTRDGHDSFFLHFFAECMLAGGKEMYHTTEIPTIIDPVALG